MKSTSSTCAFEIPFTLPDSETGVPEQISLEEVAGKVFAKIRETADLYLGEPMSHCVLSVPSFFHKNDAAILVKCLETGADVKCMRVIKDPVAACLAFGLDDPAIFSPGECGGQVVLVFDLGGASLDVSVVKVDVSGVMTVLGSSGNGSFGAGFLDDLLVDFCVKDFKRKDRKSAELLKKDDRACARLREACVQAKKALAAGKGTVRIDLDHLANEVDFSTALSVSVFEELVASSHFGEELEQILSEALENAGLDKTEINSVLMAGGGSNLPCVQNLVRDFMGEGKTFLGDAAGTSLAPDEAVAIGAARQAELLLMNSLTEGVLQTTCEVADSLCSTTDDAEEGRFLSKKISVL